MANVVRKDAYGTEARYFGVHKVRLTSTDGTKITFTDQDVVDTVVTNHVVLDAQYGESYNTSSTSVDSETNKFSIFTSVEVPLGVEVVDARAFCDAIIGSNTLSSEFVRSVSDVKATWSSVEGETLETISVRIDTDLMVSENDKIFANLYLYVRYRTS